MQGAVYAGSGRCRFSVWAPFLKEVSVSIVSGQNALLPMTRDSDGYWRVEGNSLAPGQRYLYRLEGGVERPDPASNLQPDGVHGASEIVDHSAFAWTDQAWQGIRQEDMIFYEIHTGTFTPEGTFDAIIPRIRELKDMGITVLELMPVAQFPGDRGWGYDGVYPYAVQSSYGGPASLKALVNACHAQQMAVVLDVVYNHFGPEGNYLRDFGPYFTNKYNTPWGDAVNFDNRCSDHVRRYFIDNALYYFRHYHLDALRLDALHQIYDMSAVRFLEELADEVRRFSLHEGRRHYLIGECDLNDVRMIEPSERGGHGLDALWCDDFHHALHVLLTGERTGYYEDFGQIEQMAKSLREGYVYSWTFSKARQRHIGRSSKHVEGRHFVVFSQNHDHIGNRMLGERSTALIPFEAQKLEAAVVLLSPYLPLLFMGQEYGETSPFLYFVSMGDKDLAQAIREGRRKEFEAFHSLGEAPDPQAIETFKQSQIDWNKRDSSRLLPFYKRLLQMRRDIRALKSPSKEALQVATVHGKSIILIVRVNADSEVLCLFNFEKEDCSFQADIPGGKWRLVLDSAAAEWNGSGGLLPEQIAGRCELTMRCLNAAVYERMETGA